MEELEMDHNGNAPRDVLHRLAQEDGMQEKGEEGLKKKERLNCIKGKLETEFQFMTQHLYTTVFMT